MRRAPPSGAGRTLSPVDGGARRIERCWTEPLVGSRDRHAMDYLSPNPGCAPPLVSRCGPRRKDFPAPKHPHSATGLAPTGAFLPQVRTAARTPDPPVRLPLGYGFSGWPPRGLRRVRRGSGAVGRGSSPTRSHCSEPHTGQARGDSALAARAGCGAPLTARTTAHTARSARQRASRPARPRLASSPSWRILMKPRGKTGCTQRRKNSSADSVRITSRATFRSDGESRRYQAEKRARCAGGRGEGGRA
jgi:hypothetical protein